MGYETRRLGELASMRARRASLAAFVSRNKPRRARRAASEADGELKTLRRGILCMLMSEEL